MTWRPVGHHILVRPDARPKETPSGLALPPAWAKPPGTGTIVAVGHPRTVLLSNADSAMAGFRRVSTGDFQPGQRVAYRWQDGETRTFEQPDGSVVKFLDLNEVIGVIE